MKKTIEEIAGFTWIKRWSASFSILEASYWGEQYICTNDRILGKGFENIFIAHQDGITTAYRRKEENQSFGEFLAKKAVQDTSTLQEWADALKEKSDEVRKLIALPIETFLELEQYKKFENVFENYEPFQVAVNTVPDYLPFSLFEEFQHVLEDARLYSESVYNETKEFFKKLAETISKKEQIEAKYVLCMLYEEFAQYLQSNVLVDHSILEERAKHCVLFFSQEGMQQFTGEEATQLTASLAQQTNNLLGKAIGTSAFPGYVKGTCRIVFDPSACDIFEEGDILVTGMTRPDYLLLMKKSGAIVTDVGGLLSHAAITAREMKKPCVIGTLSATTTFSEGDILEVDATKGVVKKI